MIGMFNVEITFSSAMVEMNEKFVGFVWAI
jgi:hypothetical protein